MEYSFDISIDEEQLFKSLIRVSDLEDSLLNFKSTIDGITTEDVGVNSMLSGISSDLNTMCNDLKDVYNTLKTDANILAEFSINAHLLFSLYEKGYLDEDLNWLINVDTQEIMGIIYDQNDYADVKYGNSDLKTSGCGFFSVLSSITAKTGHIFTYDEIVDLAAYAGKAGGKGGNEGRMEALATYLGEQYGFTWEKGPASEILSSLEDGKCVIGCTHNSAGNASGHFVPITGILDNGNIVINDSDSKAARYNNPNNDWYHPDNINRLNTDGFKYVYGSPNQSEFYITVRDGEQDVWYLTFNE